MKKVSIVTPVYNVEQYISECVQSVLNQTYSYIEFILVDDCGHDNSIQIAKDLLEKNKRKGFIYHIISHIKNKGVAAARNSAMKVASGDYIFCLDSDDRLEPNCIELLLIRAEETSADIVMCNHKSDDCILGRGNHIIPPYDILTNNEACIHGFAELWFNVAPWCKLIRKDFLISNNLYFREGIINEDAPWTFQLCLHANKIAFLKDKLYFYRYNKNSIMTASRKMQIQKSNIVGLQMYYDEIEKRPHLWENKDIYMIFMRQVIIYYTLTYRDFNYTYYLSKIKWLKSLKYESSFFNCKEIPATYKIWNKMFDLPYWLAGFVTYLLIFFQHTIKD